MRHKFFSCTLTLLFLNKQIESMCTKDYVKRKRNKENEKSKEKQELT